MSCMIQVPISSRLSEEAAILVGAFALWHSIVVS